MNTQTPAKTNQPKPVRLNANIRPDLHRQFKTLAASKGLTMNQILEGWIAGAVKQHPVTVN